MRQRTPRKIVAVERGERHTFLKLECGHDRSIGGNFVNDSGADGHCGKSA